MPKHRWQGCLRSYALLLLAQIPQVLKTINASFMTIAPTEVQSVAANYIEIANLEFVRNNFGFEGPLSGPFVHALSAWTYASQVGGLIITNSIISPGDAQLRIALLRNLARLDRLSSLCDVNHLDLLRPVSRLPPLP